MALAHFRMLVSELLNKDPEIVTEEAPFIVLDIKSAMFMAKNVQDTKNTRHITRRMNFVRNRGNARCTRYIVVKEVCRWQTLLLRI